jgi:hypothetical protein
MIAHCLTSLGVRQPEPVRGPDGPSFKVSYEEQSVFLRVRGAKGLLIVEVPVARFPRTQYVPALRLALELSDSDGGLARFSARGDLVMCRTVLRLAVLTPAVLADAIRATVATAVEAARVFVGALQARALTARDHRGFTVDSLPIGIDLESGAGPRGGATPLASAPSDAAWIPDEAGDDGGIPAALLPPSRSFSVAHLKQAARMGSPATGSPRVGASQPAATPPAAAPPAAAPRAAPMPAAAPRAAPMPAAPMPAAAPRAAPMPAAPPPGDVTRTSAIAPSGPTARAASSGPNTVPMAATQSPAPPRVAVQPAPPVDPMGDTFVGDVARRLERTGGPEDPLCELLHHAQALGAALSFADQPATMLLLVRATVYRAVHDFGPSLPGQVAYLHDQTASLTREIHITAPGKRRGAMAIPSATPAFEVMNRMVASRCQVSSSGPLQVQPITTSQDAKQHLARYVSEIGQAPPDLELRHFLALGALSELLVRTKLPAPTQDKLRGLVAHAAAEGPHQATVDLMLTALSRMMA